MSNKIKTYFKKDGNKPEKSATQSEKTFVINLLF